MANDVQKKIAETVASHPIVMFVKGNREMPQCGFSKAVMDIFEYLGADFTTVDVLADPEIRDGIKQFTQWPTVPQIFINGQFVGGCDIVRDLHARGELEGMVKAASKK